MDSLFLVPPILKYVEMRSLNDLSPILTPIFFNDGRPSPEKDSLLSIMEPLYHIQLKYAVEIHPEKMAGWIVICPLDLPG